MHRSRGDGRNDHPNGEDSARSRHRAVLYAARVQQPNGFRFELPVRSPRAVNGFDLPWESRHVARIAFAGIASRVLPLDHRVGDRHNDFAVVGSYKSVARFAPKRRGLPGGKARTGGGADTLDADVARCLSVGGRGVVPDVAVAYLERSGSSLSDVYGSGNRTVDSSAAGNRGAALMHHAAGIAAGFRRKAYHAIPATM